MFNLLPRLETEFPWFNLRSPTDQELFEFCEKKGIEVIIRDDVPIGVYVLTSDHHFIFLRKDLTGWMFQYVFCHEIAHYLFHSPSQSNFAIEFFDEHTKRKNHLEAEQVAALLLFPLSEIESVYEFGGDEIPEVGKLLKLRLELLRDYEI